MLEAVSVVEVGMGCGDLLRDCVGAAFVADRPGDLVRWSEPTKEQETLWLEWVAERPPAVREIAQRFEPWSLYRMKSTGQRVAILSFGEQEDGSVTLTVAVSGQFNLVMFDRNVFGIDPNDLEPCDLPAEDEAVGAVMSQRDVDDNLPALRAIATGWKES